MTAPADFYQEVDSSESFDGLEFADEVRLPFMPGRRVFVPGGIASATLNTPKGPAKLTMPAPVPTLTQFRTLESALNQVTQRLNATNTQLLQVRRELAAKKGDAGSGSTGMLLGLLMSKKLRDEFETHTHTANNTAPAVTGGASKSDSLLPLLLLQPNIFGGAAPGSPSSAGGAQEMSPLMLMVILDLF